MKSSAFTVLTVALAACGSAEPDTVGASPATQSEVDTPETSDGNPPDRGEAASEGMATARAVQYGGDEEYDACAQVATVGNLNPDGDNFLSVRAAPTVSASEVDRITSGQTVAVCESADGWHGIVYQGKLGLENCGTGTPVATRKRYDGPCQSGWVDGRFLVDFIG